MPDIEKDALVVISKLFEGYLDADCSFGEIVLKVLYQGNALYFKSSCSYHIGWCISLNRPLLSVSAKISEETIIEETGRITPSITNRTRLHSSEAWSYTHYTTKACLEAIGRDKKLKSLSPRKPSST
jgi:hypothetical protein